MPASFLTRRSALTLAVGAALPTWASAQSSYPDKPITLINPYPPGSASDVTSRQFGAEFAKALKQPIVVMNKAGAGGLIGTKFVATAPPDGYTVLVGAIGTHVFNPVINKATNYDPVKDFEPVSRIVSFPNVLVVASNRGINNVADLVALAKKAGDKPLIYGTGGNGTTSHIAAAQFENLTGSKFTAVNFQGTNNAVAELMAGRIDFVFANINVALQHIKAGTLKALAIASDKRYTHLPTTPTFNESAMPEMEMSVWSGLFVPAGTPKSIVAALSEAVKTVARSNALQPLYEASGATVEIDNTPEDFARAIQVDTRKYVPILKRMNIQAQ
jgi:tripartite-type tricarboxylate transporter receptor subunit TctC